MINSKITLFILVTFLLGVHFWYYPKWKKSATEATISWDVSGYYLYLPATFIYQDIKKCAFYPDILKKYHPTPDFQQAFRHEPSGNYVMKYPMGQAIQFAPFFAIAHLWASSDQRYPADGYSFPYQLLISLGSLLVLIIGLIVIRKSLLLYFGELAVSLALLGLVFGSNYLNYTAIDGAMTHNNLFTIYAILIFLTIRFYQSPDLFKSMGIGGLVGLAALTRPTEVLSALIPILWGVHFLEKKSRQKRWQFFKNHLRLLLAAVITCLVIGSLQLWYWKYATGDWIVYSYQDQGFSWLSPHIWDCLFSHKSGWLMYSPFMIFSVIGFFWLYREQKQVFFVAASFILLFVYVAFSWDIWWYGGSLGQRTMIQAYPVLLFPLAAFFEHYLRWSRVVQMILGLVMLLFCYVNLWFTYQAHTGGMFHAGQMNKQYYWQTIGRWNNNPEYLKLLDTKHVFLKKRKNIREIFSASEEIRLNQEMQESVPLTIPVQEPFEWGRVAADFSIGQKEWNTWKMTQMIVQLKNGAEVVQDRRIRVLRHLVDNETKRVHIDFEAPDKPYDRIVIAFWNAGSDKPVLIKNINLEFFEE